MNIQQEIQNILDRNFTRGDNANALKELLALYNVVEKSEQLVCGGCGRKYDEMDYMVGLCYECGLIIQQTNCLQHLIIFIEQLIKNQKQ